MGTLPEPSPQYLSHEETLVSFVESIARDQGISATGALDHILHTARGNEVSSLKESPPLPRLPARIRIAISAMLLGVYSSGPTCGVNEVCRPVTVQGTSQATPAMGDCALYGLLFVGLPLLRPPPLHPEAAAAVRIRAVRQMIRGMVPPVPMQEEVLHLQGLEPRTVVRLGHPLGVYCTVVQDLDGVFYIVAEPDVPYGSGMHAVLLQTTDHYTTFSPPLTNAQPVLVPSSPIMSQASTNSEALRAPATLDLYAALNVSARPLWRKTQLHVLLQELCAHVPKQVSEKQKPKRQKVAHSFPNVARLSVTNAHHLALCVDALLQHVCVRQSHLQALHIEAGCTPKSRHLNSSARMGEWLTLHLKNVAERFMCAGGGGDQTFSGFNPLRKLRHVLLSSLLFHRLLLNSRELRWCAPRCALCPCIGFCAHFPVL